MKSLLFILTISLTSVFADTMYQNGKCVSHYYTNNTSTIYLEYSNGSSSSVSSSKSKLEGLVQGLGKYYFENGSCHSIDTSNTKSFMSSLMGILIGFTIMFFSIFITIKVGAKR